MVHVGLNHTVRSKFIAWLQPLRRPPRWAPSAGDHRQFVARCGDLAAYLRGRSLRPCPQRPLRQCCLPRQLHLPQHPRPLVKRRGSSRAPTAPPLPSRPDGTVAIPPQPLATAPSAAAAAASGEAARQYSSGDCSARAVLSRRPRSGLPRFLFPPRQPWPLVQFSGSRPGADAAALWRGLTGLHLQLRAHISPSLTGGTPARTSTHDSIWALIGHPTTS